MINKGISKFFYEQTHSIKSIHDEMAKEAIEDDGIWSTFKFYNQRLPAQGITKAKLRYCKLDCDDKWLPAQRKILYKNCPELGDVRLPYVGTGSLEKVADRIKLDVAKNDNAIWSSIKVEPFTDHFTVSYDRAYVDNKPDYVKYVESDVKATEEAVKAAPRYLRASDLEIENTKRTLQRLEKNDINKSLTELHNKIYEQLGLTESLMNKLDTAEGLQKCWEKKEKEIADAGIPLRQYFPPLERLRENSYYGLYPRRSGLTTYAFDEKAKEDLKASLEIWKAKAEAIEKEGRWKSWEPALKYAEVDAKATKEAFEFMNGRYLRFDKEEKEKKDMNITLIVVPEGMSETFVRKVKANYQSNNSLRLFIASTDIDYSCEHEPIKTKYDLFEKWIKTGYVDVVYFMLGFEKDPDVRAFEAFVRGITEAEVPGKIDVRIAYQKDDIHDDENHLRTAYFDEADANEDLEKATDKVSKEVKTMRDIYGLDDEGLEAIKNSKGRIDASDELVMSKIMDVAFAEEDKPAKKGGKK